MVGFGVEPISELIWIEIETIRLVEVNLMVSKVDLAILITRISPQEPNMHKCVLSAPQIQHSYFFK